MARSSFARIVAGTALVFCCVTGSSSALADEAGAENSFQEGLKAMKRNDFRFACEAFAASNRADASPGTQINLAICYEKQNKWASAWTWYRSALSLAQSRNQAQRATNAEESANRIQAQLHYVVISVKETLTDLVVKRDGVDVTNSIAIAGKPMPLPVDPGEHTLEVSARGKLPWSKVIQVADNNLTDSIEVPKLQNAPVETKPAGAGAGAGPDSSGGVVLKSDGSSQRTVGIVVGGAGLLAGIAAVGVFALAKDQESERDSRRDAAAVATNPDEKAKLLAGQESHDDAAKQDQLIAQILGAGAVALIGVGAVLYFTAPKGSEKAASTRWSPVVGPNYAGLGLGGAF